MSLSLRFLFHVKTKTAEEFPLKNIHSTCKSEPASISEFKIPDI